MSPRASAARRHLPTSPFQPAAPRTPTEFAVDDRVTHDRHGLGTVVAIGADEQVTVRFSSGEVRLVNGAKLDKL
ncbi:hypothetical protein [Kineococcus auxinigenes]|uniref:hypothetical protein n=1 Tax=unclassified Kineococcus TaxID=2621656 RepID=UPI003D7C6A40